MIRLEQMNKMVAGREIASLNRGKEEIAKTKELKGSNSASTWYLKGKTCRVVKCQATPGCILTERLKDVSNPPGSKERV